MENDNILELVGAAKDDEKVTLTGKELRTFATQAKETAEKAAKEAQDRQYADAVRTQMPETMRAVLAEHGISVRVGETRSPYRAYTNDTSAIMTGTIVRALASAEGNWEEAKNYLRQWVEKIPTPEGEQALRAMQEQNFDSGGSMVQTMYSTEVIGLLRNMTVVRRAGARMIPVEGGNLTLHKISGGSTAQYRGEGTSVNASKLKTGQLILNTKELIGRVAISNRLLKHASLALDVIARDDLIATIAEKEDATFLRSMGGEYTPKGMRYIANAAHVVAAVNSTTPSVAQVKADLSKPVLALKTARIPMRNPAWFISPRTEEYLMSLVDGNGNPVYEKEMTEKGTIRRIPYFYSTQIPENLGVGGNESEITLADMSEIFIGEEGRIEARVDKDVTYYDEDGNLVSAYALGETVVQVCQFHDFGARYDKAIFILNEVKYGA